MYLLGARAGIGRRGRISVTAFAIVAAGVAVSSALAQPMSTASLADLSLEELSNLQITSVSRRGERLAEAPASIFVITGEDIRRSGVTSLAEALRLAPNLHVARVDSRQYAISARGFNNTIANKLLVMIDGRTVYTPLFSGVFWDAQDTLLEDIDRIEVVSGPGGTLWGTNAVNGVINVITRRAMDTVGTLAMSGAGNLESGVALRHGVSLRGANAFRVYGKFLDRDNTVRADRTPVRDEWQNGQAGFRADWGAPADGFTLQGDTYRARIEQAAPGKIDLSGANVLARWQRPLSAGGHLQLQAYLDRTERDIPGTFAEELDTLELELQHRFVMTRGHLLTWGAGHRHARDHVVNSAALAFLPAERAMNWTSFFAQDDIELGESVRLVVGSRVERNPYTAWEFLPTARLSWQLPGQRMLWGAVSRAVRAPSRIDTEFFAPGQAPFVLAGGPEFRSEVSNIFELGYRAQPTRRVSYSVTTFHSRHDHLRSVEPVGGGAFALGNQMKGTTSGAEAWASLQPHDRWRLSAGVLVLDQDLRLKAASGDTSGIAAAGNDPSHQITLRSAYDFGAGREVDLFLRRVGELPSPEVPAYTAVDARYAWRIRRGLELSATIQNLFDRQHPEFGSVTNRSEIERGIFVRVRWGD